MKKTTLLLASALALAGLSSTAAAADGQWYVRGEAGKSRISVDDLSGHDNDTTYGVRGGYWFNPNFAAEAFYSKFGDESSAGTRAKVDGVGVGIVGKKNFGPDNTGFFVDGRAGALRAKTSVSVAGLGSDSDRSTKPYVGVGAGYDFSKAFGVSLNYDYNKADAFGSGVTAKTLTVGGEFRF
jgi:opacity protein-like surface antigen